MAVLLRTKSACFNMSWEFIVETAEPHVREAVAFLCTPERRREAAERAAARFAAVGTKPMDTNKRYLSLVEVGVRIARAAMYLSNPYVLGTQEYWAMHKDEEDPMMSGMEEHVVAKLAGTDNRGAAIWLIILELYSLKTNYLIQIGPVAGTFFFTMQHVMEVAPLFDWDTQVLPLLPKLKHFQLTRFTGDTNGTEATNACFDKILRVLHQHCANLESIEMTNCNFGTTTFQALVDFAKTHPKLDTLDIGGTSVTDKDVEIFGEMVVRHPGLSTAGIGCSDNSPAVLKKFIGIRKYALNASNTHVGDKLPTAEYDLLHAKPRVYAYREMLAFASIMSLKQEVHYLHSGIGELRDADARVVVTRRGEAAKIFWEQCGDMGVPRLVLRMLLG